MNEDVAYARNTESRQVVASGRKFNFRRDLRWVAKRTSK